MQDLTSHLDYLLQYHDCVVIPGLGAVLAHTEAPRFDAAMNTWSAPRRVFSFNAELKRTDGLLASSVARRCNISTEAAARRIGNDVEALLRCIDQGGRGSLGAAGALVQSPSGALIFEPGNAAWLSPQLMWLPSFEMTPIVDIVAEQKQLVEFARRRSRLARIASTAGRVAACIAVLLGLGWVVLQNIADVNAPQFASIVPQRTEAAAPAIAESPAPVKLILAKAPANEVIENILPTAGVITSESTADYYLVVASLANKADAEKFINAHSAKAPLRLLEKDGRYRVYAASGNDAAEVMQQARRDEITVAFPDSWICKR